MIRHHFVKTNKLFMGTGAFKAAFDFRTMMHTQSKTQRASLVPLFLAANNADKARGQVDDILEECAAVFMDNDNDRAVFIGLGSKVFPPVFKPLKHGPTFDINYVDVITFDDLEWLDPDHKEVIK